MKTRAMGMHKCSGSNSYMHPHWSHILANRLLSRKPSMSILTTSAGCNHAVNIAPPYSCMPVAALELTCLTCGLHTSHHHLDALKVFIDCVLWANGNVILRSSTLKCKMTTSLIVLDGIQARQSVEQSARHLICNCTNSFMLIAGRSS